MNIEEYRAMKAKEQEQATNPGGEVVNAQVEQSTNAMPGTTQEETTQTSHAPEEQPAQTETQTIEIEGIGAVPIDELKQGYLRQSDYTKKTQELAQQRKEAEIAKKYFDALQANPEQAQRFAEENNLPYVSQKDLEFEKMKEQYELMIVKQEIETMKAKYPDFDEQSVLQVAGEKNFDNLEDAYLFTKAKQGVAQPVDIDSIKEQIRQEVLNELQSNQNTSSIIGKQGASRPIVDDTPQLTQAELRVAQGLGMTPKEYAKWRDAK